MAAPTHKKTKLGKCHKFVINFTFLVETFPYFKVIMYQCWSTNKHTTPYWTIKVILNGWGWPKKGPFWTKNCQHGIPVDILLY